MAKFKKDSLQKRSLLVADERYEETDLSRSKSQTYIGLILDSSGSMMDCWTEAIRGYNKQLQTIRKKSEHSVETWLTIFGTPAGISFMVEQGRIGDLYDLTSRNYIPYGSTPLLDSIGFTTEKMEKLDEGDPNQHFLVVAFSDGGEWSSHDYTWEKLGTLVTRLSATKRWTFVFIGPEEVHAKLKQAGYEPQNLKSWDAAQLPAMFGDVESSLDKFLEARNHGNLLPAFFERS